MPTNPNTDPNPNNPDFGTYIYQEDVANWTNIALRNMNTAISVPLVQTTGSRPMSLDRREALEARRQEVLATIEELLAIPDEDRSDEWGSDVDSSEERLNEITEQLASLDRGEPLYRDQACRSCNAIMAAENENFHWTVNTGLLCDNCYASNYFTCPECHQEMRNFQGFFIDNFNGNGERMCNSCVESALNESRIIRCSCCETFMYSTDPRMLEGIGDTCRNCVSNLEEEGRIVFRGYNNSIERPPHEAGIILTTPRKFGIELEATYSSKKSASLASLELPRDVGITSDGSIQGQGMEIVSPPMSGKEAEIKINDMCATLTKHGFKTNESCGYHIHIDTSDIDEMNASEQLSAIKRIWAFYMAYEDIFSSFLPPSRKTNRYCKTLRTEYSIDEIARARNIGELERLWYREKTTSAVNSAKSEHRHSTRYRGINLHPMFAGGHLEIRYHSGTINPTKIIEWANLHTRFVQAAIGSQYTGVDQAKNWITHDQPTLTRELFSFVGLSSRSAGYFYARQEKFRKRTRTSRSEGFIEGMKLLDNDPEK